MTGVTSWAWAYHIDSGVPSYDVGVVGSFAHGMPSEGENTHGMMSMEEGAAATGNEGCGTL